MANDFHPIRTLHLLTSLNRRGAETFAVQLVDRLSRDDFFPSIWTIDSPDFQPTYLVPQRTLVLSQNRGGHRPLAYHTLRNLVRAMRAWRPHVVQCHGGRALKYAMLAKPFWRPHAYVYTKIGSVHPWLDPLPKRLFYGFLFEQVDAIVTVGEQLRQEMESMFRPRRPRVVTITTGRATTPFADVTPETIAEKRRALRLDPSDVCLMTVGHLSWEKNPEFLVILLADLLPEYPQLKLVFVGEGPLEPVLRQNAARHGVQDRVVFAGVRADVPHLLAAADVFLLPSLTEGLPGVLIEAGMAGVPAVAFGVGSVEDILINGETGIVVPSGDRKAFQASTARLVRDGALRQRLGAQARVLCCRDFDIQRSVEKHEALFRELMEASLARSWRSIRWQRNADVDNGRAPRRSRRSIESQGNRPW